jgi:hypothetical protein
MLYDEKCKGAEAYEQLTNEFIERQKGWCRWTKNLD